MNDICLTIKVQPYLLLNEKRFISIQDQLSGYGLITKFPILENNNVYYISFVRPSQSPCQPCTVRLTSRVLWIIT